MHFFLSSNVKKNVKHLKLHVSSTCILHTWRNRTSSEMFQTSQIPVTWIFFVSLVIYFWLGAEFFFLTERGKCRRKYLVFWENTKRRKNSLYTVFYLHSSKIKFPIIWIEVAIVKMVAVIREELGERLWKGFQSEIQIKK